ncbi:MAG: UDP-N-acetylglucosamine--N-acetylmuramyl-(pentapeptide) pyrophosphoryl-undecaprenol N-acetylglucosamine transferase [Patescibacteria group bacterium]
MEKPEKTTIILSGGGSGGPVTTLLAVSKELIKDNSHLNLIFIGTKKGPERLLIDSFRVYDKHIKFIAISSGKLRRYFSVANFLDFFKIFSGFIISFLILSKEKPNLVISAGGFVSVPLVWAAYLKKIPILIHQQDVRPGLANRLMAPFARLITVSFEKSLSDYGPKAVWIGNPSNQLEQNDTFISGIKEKYNLQSGLPLILVTGGGTGSQAINNLIIKALPKLISSAQIIHLTGKGKLPIDQKNDAPNYQAFEFLNNDEVFALMSISTLVISRCGLASLTELCALEKPAILIPIPDSQQEDNAEVFKRYKAAVVLNQKTLSVEELIDKIKEVLVNNELRKNLTTNIFKIMKKNAAETMASLIWEILAPKE